ncbi:MAG: hypothetical protein WAU81_11925, partial [Candidatus Aminicenantales bacterium]
RVIPNPHVLPYYIWRLNRYLYPYYYAVESARVSGKPRIVWQKYLGTLDSILKRLDQTKPAAPKEAVLFEAGGIAALLRMAQRLKVIDLM